MVVLVDRAGAPVRVQSKAEVAQTQWASAAEPASAIDAAPPWLVEHFPLLVPHIAEQLSEAGEND